MFIITLFAVSALSCSGLKTPPQTGGNLLGAEKSDSHVILFRNWQQEYNKAYNNVDEEAQRFTTFMTNLRKIAQHNTHADGYVLDLNEFADMTADEFRLHIHGNTLSCFQRQPGRRRKEFSPSRSFVNLPAAVDWVAKGAVTPVKNQKACGSCWAFSATGSLEGRIAIKTGKLTSLSEQQLVDCSRAEGNQGCQGGLMDNAFKYAQKAHGLCSETDYPYEGSNLKCRANCTAVHDISGFVDVTHDSEPDLRAAVAAGPVSVAIEADQLTFQFYKRGILKAKCGATLDHGVLVVGYGTENGVDYWKVKNSWGPKWGEDGYIRLCRNCSKNTGAGECGILMQPSYPTV